MQRMLGYIYLPKMSTSRAVSWLTVLSISVTACMYLIYMALYGGFQAQSKRVTSSKLETSTGSHTGLGVQTTEFQDLVAKFENQIKLVRVSKPLRINISCELTDKVCLDDCVAPITASFESRLNSLVNSPRLTLTSDQRGAILTMAQSIPESKHIFVTAVDARRTAEEVRDMIRFVHLFAAPIYLNKSIIVVFDIGLTQEQRLKITANPFCLVVKFRSDLFPPHVGDIDCMSWKPLILMAAMKKAQQLVVFQDARLKWTKNMNAALYSGMAHGIHMFRASWAPRIPVNTLKQTFDYFHEKPCGFSSFPEIYTSALIIKNNEVVNRAILEPWARCALEATCSCPVAPAEVTSCVKSIRNHRCHRFDQSILGLITAKLLGRDVNRVVDPDISKYLAL